MPPTTPTDGGARAPLAATDSAASPTDGGALEVIADSFEALYPIFLLRKVAPREKAMLWNRYNGRWIRWTGKLVAFTRDGAAFRMIPETTTFDVSLIAENAARDRLRRYPLGQPLTFVGRLQSYDDIFRTFYVTHGDVAPAPAPARP